MSNLTPRETELVALGAALGSNCVPCIEYHIPQARKAGLTDPEIQAAIQLADKVRQVPARKVLDTALNLLPHATAECGSSTPAGARDAGCGCGGASKAQESEPANADRTIDTMTGMMSKMMSSCAADGGCNAPGK
jgi:AhpD family alkylhydroperoxidase